MKTSNLIVILGLMLAHPLAADTTPTAPETQKLTPAEIETLVAPIALYPDVLIGIILPASTNAADIVLAARYLEKGGAADQVDNQSWDESVRSLAHYPDVLKWMDENLEWTQQLGVTFLTQPEEVMAAIQRLRVRADTLGNLPTTAQLTVVREADYIRIVPTVTEMLYVPYYDPEVIYVSRYYWSFSPAWVCGPWLMFDCNWIRRSIWYGAWRPVYFHRPAWVYVDRRPPPPRYVERHTWRPNPHRPSSPPPPRRPGEIARPRPINDSHFHNRPGQPPPANRPGQRPGNSTDTRRPPGKGAPPPGGRTDMRTDSRQRPNPPPETTTPRQPQVVPSPQVTPSPQAPAQLNDSGKSQRPPSSTTRPAQRPARTRDANVNNGSPPAQQRQSRDVSRTRVRAPVSQPPSVSSASANTQPRQSAQPARPAESSRPASQPSQRTTTRDTSDTKSSGSSSDNSRSSSSSSTTTSSSSSSNSSRSTTSNNSSSSSRSTSSSNSDSRSSYQPRSSSSSSSASSSSRQSSPPPRSSPPSGGHGSRSGGGGRPGAR
jgi:hypothetical protein